MKISRFGMGFAVGMLILALLAGFAGGCAEPTETPTTPAPTTPAPTTPAPTTPAPTTPAPTTPAPTTPPPTTEGPKYGGDLVMAYYIPRVPGYPPEMVTYSDMHGIRPCVETLLRYDEKGHVSANLATGWEISPDNKAITFTLRQGVKFHDGTEFNAEAVKYNLEGYMATPRPELQAVTSVDVIDTYTIRLNLSEFDATLLGNLCEWAGHIVSPMSVETNGVEWCRTNAVGTGPFKFVSFMPNESIKYTRNDDYWQEGKPYIDSLELIDIRDNMVKSAALQAKEILAGSINEGSIVKDLLATGKFNMTWGKVRMTGLISDSAHPDSPFYDLRVRQALGYAIDGQTAVDVVYGGIGEALTQPAFKGSLYYNEDVVGYPYDPEKARALLAEAGYPNGFDTTLIYPSGNDMLPTVMQGMLAEVGINAELSAVEFAKFLALRTEGWDNGMLMEALDTAQEREPVKCFRSFFSGFSINFKNVAFPTEFDETIAQASVEPDDAKRAELNKKLNRMISEYALSVPICSDARPWFSYKYVHDIGEENLWMHQWTPEDIWIGEEE